MKSAVFEHFGEPAEVLSVRDDRPIPEPGPGQVRVRMTLSPVNPSDLLVVRGLYGVLPTPPATPGFEGVGVVDKVGSGLLGRLVKGKRVTAINDKGGNWAEYAIIPARQARPIPSYIPDEQAASYFVNPATVLAMVSHVLKVPKGAYLLQTAAGSALGKMIIKYCKHQGIRTINVVRRAEAVAELKKLGGDIVLNSSDGPIDVQVRSVVDPKGVTYALDPVGGDTGTQVFNALATDARMLVYGTLSGEPIRVDSRKMIAGKRVVEGFWLGHWIRRRSIPQSLAMFREIGHLIRDGVLDTEVGAVLPLSELTDAVRRAEVVGKSGKVLLKIGE